MPIQDYVDLWFTREGDFSIDDTGDLKDTGLLTGRAILQEARTRLNSRKGEWSLDKTVGSDLIHGLGEGRTARQIQVIVQMIVEALTASKTMKPGDIEVLPLPIGSDGVLFRIVIKSNIGNITDDLIYSTQENRFIR